MSLPYRKAFLFFQYENIKKNNLREEKKTSKNFKIPLVTLREKKGKQPVFDDFKICLH